MRTSKQIKGLDQEGYCAGLDCSGLSRLIIKDVDEGFKTNIQHCLKVCGHLLYSCFSSLLQQMMFQQRLNCRIQTPDVSFTFEIVLSLKEEERNDLNVFLVDVPAVLPDGEEYCCDLYVSKIIFDFEFRLRPKGESDLRLLSKHNGDIWL